MTKYDHRIKNLSYGYYGFLRVSFSPEFSQMNFTKLWLKMWGINRFINIFVNKIKRLLRFQYNII